MGSRLRVCIQLTLQNRRDKGITKLTPTVDAVGVNTRHPSPCSSVDRAPAC